MKSLRSVFNEDNLNYNTKQKVKKILMKKLSGSRLSEEKIEKIINQYYDFSVRRGARTPGEIAKEIFNFYIYT